MVRTLHNYIRLHYENHKYEWFLVLFVLCVLWPFTFQYYIPKWDNIDGYLPYRHMVSYFLNQGLLPLWHPFENLGNPLYSDLQSGAWNPIVWALSFLYGSYDIKALITELMLCYIIAALGMFRLSIYLFKNKKIALILAISYAFSGFMVGSSQLMVFLIGVAWLPFSFYYLYKVLRGNDRKDVLKLALVLALHITAASPAFTILLIYSFTLVILYEFWTKRKNLSLIKTNILQLSIVLSVLLLLIAPYLSAFYDFSPYFNRLEELSLERFLINPFTTKEYISFVFPYSTVAQTEIFSETDLSLRNGYFGIIGLGAALSTWIFVRNKKVLFLTLGVVVSLLFAAGGQTDLYVYFSKFPGIGLFRHPSLFRGYTIFLSLLMAGITLKHLYDQQLLSKALKVFFSIAGFFFIVFLIRGGLKTDLATVKTTLVNVWNFVEFSETNASGHMAINAFIWLVFIVFGLLALRFKMNPFKILIFIVGAEFFILTQLLAPTNIYQNTKYDKVGDYFNALRKEFDQTHNQEPLKNLRHGNDLPYVRGFWKNLSILNKRPSFDGYNPLRFKNYDQALDNGRLDFVIENPILYFPTKKITSFDSIFSGAVWNIDNTISINGGKIHEVRIENNGFKTHVENSSEKSSFLIVNQNFHHNWKAYIQYEEIEVYLANDMVMGVIIPPKFKGEVLFEFTSTPTKVLLVISLVSYFFTFLVLLIKRKKIIH